MAALVRRVFMLDHVCIRYPKLVHRGRFLIGGHRLWMLIRGYYKNLRFGRHAILCEEFQSPVTIKGRLCGEAQDALRNGGQRDQKLILLAMSYACPCSPEVFTNAIASEQEGPQGFESLYQ